MATSFAYLPRGRNEGAPIPLLKSTNVIGDGASAPNEAYFPGYYPGYTTYESLTNDKTQFDPNVQVNVGPDQGQSTVGFRTNKYSPKEWHQNNYAKYYQAFSDRNVSEHDRWDSNRFKIHSCIKYNK